MRRWRFTWLNNPITWALALVLGVVAVLLLVNVAFGSDVIRGMPPHTLVHPTGASAAQVLAEADSVTLRATEAFEVSALQQSLYGRAYREAWATPVTVPVLRLDRFAGGLRPVKRGGGFQTLSLDVVDTAGVVYTLRSVTKNPDQLVPTWAPYLGIENIVTDGISAGHPYGALAAAALADLAGIPHMRPALYYVPAQPALDTLPDYRNRLFWLEYEPDGDRAPWLGMACFRKWEDSDDVFEEWRADSLTARPDLRALVRARLFDIWVGDWDRHDGQWGWAACAEAGGYTRYIPVPNDRDNIFYGISGMIPLTIAAFERRLRPFGREIDDIKGLTKNSAPFDGAFLYEVPERVFVEEAEALRTRLTDAGIERAMRTAWPPDVYEIDGARIAGHLKTRRDRLVDYAREFHRVVRARGPSDTVEN